MQEETGCRERSRKDLHEFQPPRDNAFDKFVGEFAAEAGEDKERKDEDCTRHGHQRVGMSRDRAVEQDDDERVLEDIIVERRAELRPEQRRKAARRHQFLDHG